MNHVDFSQPGGFKLTENTMEFMQASYIDAIIALCQPGVAVPANTPVIISGMQVSGSHYYDGFFFYNGELIKFTGVADIGLIPACAGGLVLGYVITETVTQLEFFDGNIRDARFAKTAALGCGANAVSADFIPLTTAFKTYAEYLEPTGKTAEVHVGGISNNGVTGDVYYRKNKLTNTLHVRGTLTLTAASVSATPTYTNLASLSSAYRPASQDATFVAVQRYHSAVVMDSTSTFDIRHLNCELKTNGDLNIGAIKGATDYTVTFNVIIPLD